MGLSSATVLVVDDEPLIRMHAVDLMEEAGLTVFEAYSGPHALTVLSAHPEIAALFTDIQMPGGFDGLALARMVHEMRPDIRLVITSGNVRPDASEMPDDGRFVAKPYDGSVVARLILDQIGHA